MTEEADETVAAFTERFADYWQSRGAPRSEGLIAGCLLIDDSGGLTAEQIARRLGLSRGSVSTGTRRLAAAGFIERIPGAGGAQRHIMADDVWGGFLAREQEYLADQQRLAAWALERVSRRSRAHTRLQNMHDYMCWLRGERGLLSEWEAHKAARDGGRPPGGEEAQG